ncbi:hypothetical protein JCM10908_001981 [Rhodotorula pacifica]|uniref:VPS9 domain-containing protein n=1 Tax=Rhodotorula pacifica TaxID=1495444 RepID=UPI003174DE59
MAAASGAVATDDATDARLGSTHTLSRPSSRRTLRSVPSSDPAASAHPLLGSSADSASSSNASGSYAVYDKSSRKRAGSSSQHSSSTSVLSPPSSVLSANEGPLAPSPSSSTVTTPPFTPSSTHSLPPLISRPSSTQLPPPAQGRQYARSVSEAKEQLQRQALKAELQDLGLSAESAGAALVSRLGTLEDDAELKSLAPAVRSGKLTLLLPAERLDPEGSLGLPFLLDHLILLDPPSTTSDLASLAVERPFATLSGLRGLLSGGELIFTSCVAVPKTEDLPPFHDEGVQRSFRGVTPLPAPPTSAHYPSSMLISAITTLSIPQSRSSSVVSPPPASRTTSRLAALFAKPSGTSLDVTTSTAVATAASPSAELADSRSSSQSRHPHSVDIPVLAVGKIIRYADVVSTMSSALLAHLRQQCRDIEGLTGETGVTAVIDAFARQFEPTRPADATAGKAAANGEAAATATASLLEADVEILAETYQVMMQDIRLDLARNLGSVEASDPSAAAPSLEDFAQLEERIDASLEKLEAAVTSTMYDRLFAPSSSHDLQEDENLASRIAALNVLGLDLEHLGIDLDSEQELEDDWHRHNTGPRDSLELLATRVGKELNHLEDPSELTPTAKLAILVECHKIIVDGLSDLPAIRLKKEITADDKSSLSERPAVVEMDDASSRSSSLPPSRPRSPTPSGLAGELTEDDLLRTPRPPSLEERPVPEIRLPEAAQGLSASVLEATSSSMLSAALSPPTSVFDTSPSRGRSSPATSNSSSADLILPLLIYSVVRANPPHLVSHLRYIHRFRAESLLRGQASYCATNFDAVIEWSQHVDLSTLGLSSESVIAGAPANPSQQLSTPSTARPRAYTTPSTFLRERVSLTADQLVDTANSALTGVVDSSYRLLFGAGGLASSAPKSLDDVKNVLDGARGRAREKLPFRRSNSARDFPTLIAGRRRATSVASGKAATIAETGAGADSSAPEASSTTSAPPPLPPRPQSPIKEVEDLDTRSVRSVSSFLGFRESTIGRAIASHTGGHASDRQEAASPENSPSSTSLGGRLLGRIADGASSSARRATLLNPLSSWSGTVPSLAPVPASPAGGDEDDNVAHEYQPVQRFLEISSAQDLKLGEVQELLNEYRKAVKALRARPIAVPAEVVPSQEVASADGGAAVEASEEDEKSV